MASETFEKMTRNFDVSFSQCTLLESHVNASEKASAIQQQDKKQQHQKQEHQQHLHQKHLHQQDHNQQEIKMEDNATTKLDAGQKEGIGMKSTLDSHMGQWRVAWDEQFLISCFLTVRDFTYDDHLAESIVCMGIYSNFFFFPEHLIHLEEAYLHRERQNAGYQADGFVNLRSVIISPRW